jgi:hypothetical protein
MQADAEQSHQKEIHPIKRLQIKDIKKTIDRLNEITKEQKRIKSNSLHIPINCFDEKIPSKMQNNEKNEIKPELLKHQIIKNMLFEKFLERKELKKNRTTKNGFSSFRPSTPKIIKSFINVEQEFLAKIKTRNINHLDPNHNFYYLKNSNKLSDSHLLRQTNSHHYDPTSIKKLREDNKAKNILDSNLKYHIDLMADEYIDSLKKFKELSREYNNKIVLKEKLKHSTNKTPRFSLKPPCNISVMDSSFNRFRNTTMFKNKNKASNIANEKQISFQDYMHFSDLIKKHKEGSARLVDAIVSDELSLEKINTCGKYKKHIEREKIIEQREEDIKRGKIKRNANCSFIELKIKNNTLIREKAKSLHNKKNENSYLHNDSLDNDDDNSLGSVTENKLDKLYDESRSIQKKIETGQNNSLAERMKQIIRLEKLNRQLFISFSIKISIFIFKKRLIISINKKKLSPEIK